MARENRIGQDDLMLRIGEEDVLDAVMAGAFVKPTQQINEGDIQNFASKIQRIISASKSKNEDLSQIREGGEVYIARLEFPSENMVYYTVMNRGRLDFMSGTEGIVDIKSLRDRGLVGPHSLDTLFQTVFEQTAMPLAQRVKRKLKKGILKKEKIERRKSKIPLTAKVQVQYVIDPRIQEYLQNKEPFLTAQALARGEKPTIHKIVEKDELSSLMSVGQVSDFVNGGFNLTLMSAVDFISDNRNRIQKTRRRRLEALVSTDPIVHKIKNYFENIGAKTKISDALEFLEKSSNARHCYEYFTDKSNRIPGVHPEEMIDALRYIATQHVANDNEKVSKLNRSMSSWIAVAKAARFVDQDERISKVLPLFADVKDTDVKELSGRVYEGTRQLASLLLNRDLNYSLGEIPFIINGLWLKGYFTKRKKIDENEEDQRAGASGDREVKGVDTQFTHPVKHLMRRYERYDAILDPAFEKLLAKGDIPKDTKLTSQMEFYRLGLKLYNEIPQKVAERTFTKIKDETALSPPREESSSGRTMEWVLSYYIGVKKDELLSRIREHYEEK